MTEQMTLSGETRVVGRTEKIRDLFATTGGAMSTRDFAHVCIEQGFYSEEDRDLALLRMVQGEIRSALKKPDASGLPFAGQTVDADGDGPPVWKQRQFWMYVDYVLNIRELIDNRDENHHAALLLRDECLARFGLAPAIPPLEEEGLRVAA